VKRPQSRGSSNPCSEGRISPQGLAPASLLACDGGATLGFDRDKKRGMRSRMPLVSGSGISAAI